MHQYELEILDSVSHLLESPNRIVDAVVLPEEPFCYQWQGYAAWNDTQLVKEPPGNTVSPRYMDLRSDIFFKQIFAKESNKDLLLDLVRSLHQEWKDIRDLRHGPVERPPETAWARNAFFDLQFTTDRGDQFLMEMQRRRQDAIFRRLLHYTMRMGGEQIPSGKSGDDFPLPKINAISILNFDPWQEIGVPPGQEEIPIKSYLLQNEEDGHNYPSTVRLMLVELPRFNKNLGELKTRQDKWLFLLKHLKGLREQPAQFAGPIFDKLFQLTDLNKLPNKERKMIIDYEREQRNIRKALKREAREEGIQEGREEGREKGIQEGREKGRKEGIREGIREGKRQKDLAFVQALLKETDFDDRKIAFLAGVEEGFVRKVRSGS